MAAGDAPPWITALASPKLRLAQPAGEEGQLLRRTLRFVLVLLCGIICLAVGVLVGLPVPFAAAAGSVALVSGLSLGTSLWRVHERIERIVLGVFDPQQPLPSAQAEAAHDELAELIREEYGGEVETADLVLPLAACAANRTIRELRLRTETGASIVAIYRDNEFLPNPSPEAQLMPGSVLLLMGRREQLQRAFAYLRQLMSRPAAPPTV